MLQFNEFLAVVALALMCGLLLAVACLTNTARAFWGIASWAMVGGTVGFTLVAVFS